MFSRTQDFVEGFAQSLAQFDTVTLLDIYPARELPIDGVTSEWLLSKIAQPLKKIVSKEDLITRIKAVDADVVLTIGAGDIGLEVDKLKNAMMQVV